MSIDLLESSDLSETRLGTNLAKTLRDVGRAAGMPHVSKDDDVSAEPPPECRGKDRSRPHSGSTPAPIFDFNVPTLTGNPPSLEEFFQSQNELDLSYLLSLTRDSDGTLFQNDGNWSTSNIGNTAPFGDLDFAMAGAGTGRGLANSSWNGNVDGLGTQFQFNEDSAGTG